MNKMIEDSPRNPPAGSPKAYHASAFDQEYLQTRLGLERLAQAPYDPAHFQKHFSRYWHILDVKKDDTVLNLGCGTGYNSWWFAQMAEQVVGVDISAKAIAFAQKHYQKANLRYRQVNILEWEPEEKFSVIIMLAVFEHLPAYEGNLFLERVKNWLKPNGRIAFHVPIGKSWVDKLKKRRRKLISIDSTGDPTHLRRFSANEFRNLLRAKGYEILGESPVYGSLVLSRKWIRRLVRLLRPPLLLKDQLTMDLFLVLTPLEI